MTDKEAGKINLDLIDMVQRARMQHDQVARPSDYAAVYWIEAKDQAGANPGPTSNAGEWRLRLRVETVDAVWDGVRRATEAGRLGYKSKVSTRPAAGQADPDERLICVRTYDADDAEDIARIRRELMGLGLDDLDYVGDK
jgi:hypothetical protein